MRKPRTLTNVRTGADAHNNYQPLPVRCHSMERFAPSRQALKKWRIAGRPGMIERSIRVKPRVGRPSSTSRKPTPKMSIAMMVCRISRRLCCTYSTSSSHRSYRPSRIVATTASTMHPRIARTFRVCAMSQRRKDMLVPRVRVLRFRAAEVEKGAVQHALSDQGHPSDV
ncbi:MAG: hypothetical protein G01um101477_373 [Candidatus Doudnabacteria bacterium Gr01-1014_77]|uniref:Uncharacterized protein n=1 Tax=Candidatus Doudnabacteria bacterium Gr01-1014_77 TaxID=2017133 RepID=A0A554JBF0_9BACT|nr:MAG: hypothetical protein G01um101477_373 [Candidatus Doudnabacteria bacterium Gr01-1014_77]